MLDELNAPILPTVVLLHLLTALSTSRTFMRRYSFSWSMAQGGDPSGDIQLQGTVDLDRFAGDLDGATVSGVAQSPRPTRVYVIHMGLFVGLLIVGWSAVTLAGGPSAHVPWWAAVPLLVAILVRCGTVPAHCWVTDWFEHASPGIAMLFVVPLSGVYAAVRLVLPIGSGLGVA